MQFLSQTENRAALATLERRCCRNIYAPSYSVFDRTNRQEGYTRKQPRKKREKKREKKMAKKLENIFFSLNLNLNFILDFFFFFILEVFAHITTRIS